MIRFKPLPYLLAAVSLLALPMAQAEELPEAIKAVEARGAEVVGRFEAPGGLKGYAARYNGQGMALYLTPDGEHVLIGSLLDAKGEDLTRAHLEKLVYEPLGKEMWTRMENSTWIADGKADAPRIIYMFSDPNCPYCNMFWKQARPWVESGKVQLRHIMVGMLRAVGTTRRQLRRMIRWESVITSIIGGVLGVLIGILFGWVTAQGLEAEGIVFILPVGTLLLFLALSIVAGVVAAILPARRAAKLDVLEALQYE